MTAETVIKGVYEDVLRRNPGEAEFHQAVKEVIDSLDAIRVRRSFTRRSRKLLTHWGLYWKDIRNMLTPGYWIESLSRNGRSCSESPGSTIRPASRSTAA